MLSPSTSIGIQNDFFFGRCCPPDMFFYIILVNKCPLPILFAVSCLDGVFLSLFVSSQIANREVFFLFIPRRRIEQTNKWWVYAQLLASLKSPQQQQMFTLMLTRDLLIVHFQSSSWPYFAAEHLFQLIVSFISFLFQLPALPPLQLLQFLHDRFPEPVEKAIALAGLTEKAQTLCCLPCLPSYGGKEQKRSSRRNMFMM